MITNYNLFLDDVRVPHNVTWVNLPSDQHYSVVRSYNEFVELIKIRGIPKFVTYDHDLANSHYGDGLHGDDINYNKYKEKTGYDCVKWLVNECMKKGVKHPPYMCHSMNPVGKQNIINYVESYNRSIKD